MTARNSLQLKLYIPLAVALLAVGPARAQVPDRITRPIDASQVHILARHHPLWAVPANDAGIVPGDLTVKDLTLLLARSSQQEETFEQLINDQKTLPRPIITSGSRLKRLVSDSAFLTTTLPRSPAGSSPRAFA